MLRVGLAQAKPGMTLALPVYHPLRHDTCLLAAGVALDQRTIARLREIGLTDAWIRYPGVELIDPYLSPSVIEAQATMTHHVREALDVVAQGQHARLEFLQYRAAVASLMTELTASPRAMMFIQEMVTRDQPALAHASNVCMMSLLMGLKLDGYLIVERSRLASGVARDVTDLGVGGMMHDIGMLRLDPGVLHRWNTTQDESDPAWREHVRLGYEMVQGAVGPAAASAVLHHHQAFDGSGFPRRRLLDDREEPVAGSDIHVFARIIAAADVFDRLRHARHSPGEGASDRAAIPVVRVLRALRGAPHADRIDPMVFKALLAVVPAYAPGTIVKLSNGRTCVVTEWFPEDPCRPDCQEIGDVTRDFDRPGFQGEKFLLRMTPGLEVVEAEGHPVARDNFYPDRPDEFDLTLAGKTLFNAAAKTTGPRKVA
ncbi:MAG: HD-GYP domain-containing protein [Phycisphaerales bacterium]